MASVRQYAVHTGSRAGGWGGRGCRGPDLRSGTPSSRAQREALRIGRTGDGAVGSSAPPPTPTTLPATLIRLTTEESGDFEIGGLAESFLGGLTPRIGELPPPPCHVSRSRRRPGA